MKNLNFCTVIIITSFFLSSCGKQPTEVVKASLEKNSLECMLALTTPIKSMEELKENSGDFLGALGQLGEAFTNLGEKASSVSGRSWLLEESDDKAKVTMTIKTQDTKFDCIFESDDDKTWTLTKVDRNGETVFDLISHTENQAKNEKLKEEVAILEKERKERERVEAIKTWQEKSYSNVDYKYYRKRHVDSQSDHAGSELDIICDPDGVRVKFDDGKLRFDDQPQVPFFFSSGDTVKEMKFDLTSNGAIGKFKDSSYGIGSVYTDLTESERFIAALETYETVVVKKTTFNIDDLSQVPCLR